MCHEPEGKQTITASVTIETALHSWIICYATLQFVKWKPRKTWASWRWMTSIWIYVLCSASYLNAGTSVLVMYSREWIQMPVVFSWLISYLNELTLCPLASRSLQYWPDQGKSLFGPIEATLVNTEVFPDYVIRTLCLLHSKVKICFIMRQNVLIASVSDLKQSAQWLLAPNCECINATFAGVLSGGQVG